VNKILEIENLQVNFSSRKKIVRAVNGISFHLSKTEALGIVGESGCGKSASMMSILGLLADNADVSFDMLKLNGKELDYNSSKVMRSIRGSEIGMIFQDPMTCLNPVMNIGAQLSEGIRYHKKLSKKEALKKCKEILTIVGIPDAEKRLKDYPYQLSGGMRQRVMIAMALINDPKILLADEPTTALDVTIQAQIVKLVKKMREIVDLSLIWITHDLSLLAGLVDRIIVMYAGNIVEEAQVNAIYKNPLHPYTKGLLNAIPSNQESTGKNLVSIPGMPPDVSNPIEGCSFAPRCEFATEQCRTQKPMLKSYQSDETHRYACWNVSCLEEERNEWDQ